MPRFPSALIAFAMVLAAVPASLPAVQPAAYLVTDLGSFPGSYPYRAIVPALSVATAINASGQTTGYSLTAANFYHPFLWTARLGLKDLGHPPGTPTGGASALNDRGQIVGWPDSDYGSGSAFLWSASTGMTSLGFFPGGSNSAAYGINNAGHVVGLSDGAGFFFHAFLWTAASGMTDLGTLTGNTASNAEALGINPAGLVVGDADTTLPDSAGFVTYHAFLWTPLSGMTDLGTLTGNAALNSWANAINPSAHIVGGSDTALTNPDGSPINHAFLWTPADGMTDLGALAPAGALDSAAYAINASGQVVGTFNTGHADSSGNAIYHAFLWSASTGFHDLNRSLGNSTWQLIQANGINNSGQIVGYGTSTHGLNHAFLLTPLTAAAITTQPTPVSASPGQTITLTVAATGTKPLTYAWQRNRVQLHNAGNISGVTTSTLTITRIRPNESGNYRVLVTNPAGSITSISVQLTVK